MKFLNLEDYLNFGENPIKDIEFENRIKEYNVYFSNEIKNKLPDIFLNEYYLYHGFHDWKLIAINMCYENNSMNVTLFDKENRIKKTIVYHVVTLFKTNFSEEHFNSIMNNDFGIDEFGIVDNGHFSHEVYFPSGASYIVHFSKIEII